MKNIKFYDMNELGFLQMDKLGNSSTQFLDETYLCAGTLVYSVAQSLMQHYNYLEN